MVPMLTHSNYFAHFCLLFSNFQWGGKVIPIIPFQPDEKRFKFRLSAVSVLNAKNLFTVLSI